MVCFGGMPAVVPEAMIDNLKKMKMNSVYNHLKRKS